MHRGHPEYRCIVNNMKSMVNFDLEISGEKINKIHNPGGIYFIVVIFIFLFYI
jgi:hypothetical protein